MFQVRVIDDMKDYTQYTALTTDTTGPSESAVRLTGTNSLEFSKVDGVANGKAAGASRTLPGLNLEADGLLLYDKIMWSVYCSVLTAVASCYVKLGTDATHYLMWTVTDGSMAAGWALCEAEIGTAELGGNGWDPSNITYMEVGVTFDSESDALDAIKFDSVSIVPCRFTTT